MPCAQAPAPLPHHGITNWHKMPSANWTTAQVALCNICDVPAILAITCRVLSNARGCANPTWLNPVWQPLQRHPRLNSSGNLLALPIDSLCFAYLAELPLCLLEDDLLCAARGRYSRLHPSNSASQCPAIPGDGTVWPLLENCLCGMLQVVMHLEGFQDPVVHTVLQNSCGLD